MNTLQETLAARETFLAYIVTTALEGGIGYWSACHEYRWWYPDLEGGTAQPAPHGGGNAFASITLDDDEEQRLWEVTPKVIASAFNLLLADDYRPSVHGSYGPEGRVLTDWSTWPETVLGCQGSVPSLEWRDRMLRARKENDAGEIDAGDADSLVQLGLWGAVVYG